MDVGLNSSKFIKMLNDDKLRLRQLKLVDCKKSHELERMFKEYNDNLGSEFGLDLSDENIHEKHKLCIKKYKTELIKNK